VILANRARPLRRAASALALALTLSALVAAPAFATPRRPTIAPPPAPSATLVPGINWPVQSAGDRGTDVSAIQRLLRLRIADTPLAVAPPAPDGLFGSSTVAAVKSFQASRGLAATGIVDGPTWAKLIVGLGAGMTGEAVVALQTELVEKRRVTLAIDATFGPATTAAVSAFQRHIGLPVTGLATASTWRALVWHYELPRFGSAGLCDYSVGNGAANWGTAEAIDTLEAVGRSMVVLGYGRIAVGDASFEHGGNIPGHETHEQGLDVDMRPLRKANDQCTVGGTRWSSSTYDRTATRAMIAKFRRLAPGHIKVIYFNDPVLIREGLTRWFAGHDDHVHVRFCEKVHPLATYDC
jgi:peptidoglycan hydrolase-like protein with peptidoglycan-binding domain